MTRKFPSSAVDHSLAAKYLTKANRFKADAENMAQLSEEFSGNGVAVLCVHAAIAYGDDDRHVLFVISCRVVNAKSASRLLWLVRSGRAIPTRCCTRSDRRRFPRFPTRAQNNSIGSTSNAHRTRRALCNCSTSGSHASRKRCKAPRSALSTSNCA